MEHALSLLKAPIEDGRPASGAPEIGATASGVRA